MAGRINFDALHYTKPPVKKKTLDDDVQEQQWILPDLPPLDSLSSYQPPTSNPKESIGRGIEEFFSELEAGTASFFEEVEEGFYAFGREITEAIEDMADFFRLK